MRAIFTAAVLFVSTAAGQQQTGAPAGIPMPAAPSPETVTSPTGMAPATLAYRVRVVDGRNGAAVRDVHVKLWYDESSGHGYQFVTDDRGVGLMPEPVGEPIRVLATVTDAVDCRKPARGTPPDAYNLEQIAKSGAQGQNTCGQVAIRTQPGELVLYVRSAHWYEGINRDQR
jgi:hypothetical protein